MTATQMGRSGAFCFTCAAADAWPAKGRGVLHGSTTTCHTLTGCGHFHAPGLATNFANELSSNPLDPCTIQPPWIILGGYQGATRDPKISLVIECRMLLPSAAGPGRHRPRLCRHIHLVKKALPSTARGWSYALCNSSKGPCALARLWAPCQTARPAPCVLVQPYMAALLHTAPCRGRCCLPGGASPARRLGGVGGEPLCSLAKPLATSHRLRACMIPTTTRTRAVGRDLASRADKPSASSPRAPVVHDRARINCISITLYSSAGL
jgi:hypothetical protein